MAVLHNVSDLTLCSLETLQQMILYTIPPATDEDNQFSQLEQNSTKLVKLCYHKQATYNKFSMTFMVHSNQLAKTFHPASKTNCQ